MTNVSMDDIKKVVSLQLGVRQVNDNSLLVEDLSAESADVANIVASLEEKYQITVTEPEIARIRTPADLLELVNKHRSLRGHSS
jgi:acyl carrier protein